jgi:hypothetical protein
VPTSMLLDLSEQLGEAGVTNFKIIGTEYLINLAEPHDGIFDTIQLFLSDNLRWTSIGFSDTDAAIEVALKMKADCLATVENTLVHN